MRNDSVFASLPSIEDVPRSKFDRPSTLHTTFNAGDLVPIFLDEVVAGDTFDMNLISNVRMTTPIVPVMDSCFLDTYFFFVPSRLCWNRWKEFCGENPRSNWTNELDDNIRLPHVLYNGVQVDDSDYLVGSLVDYFGLPIHDMRNLTETEGLDPRFYTSFNMLPFEAYNLIWNEFFRDENIMEPTPLYLQNTSIDDSEALYGYYYNTYEYLSPLDGINAGDYTYKGSYLQIKRACKFHDYFTSCLPQPQKHSPIVIPGFESFLNDTEVYSTTSVYSPLASSAPINMAFDSGEFPSPFNYLGVSSVSGDVQTEGGSSPSGVVSPKFTNLHVNFAGQLPNINDLRNAFALQRLFEKDARGGSRYIEQLRIHFNVTSPDARLQIPEYLGGSRIDIAMNQVVQTSSTDGTTPQGNVSGLSHTFDMSNSFFKSFTEPGYIIGLAVVRPIHSYEGGINKLFLRERRFDFYYPSLAFIGEQPVMKAEIDAGDTLSYSDSVDDVSFNVFGYQEAWADYRYKPNLITGKMRSGVDGSLNVWHYGSGPSAVTSLSPAWIVEQGDTIQRSLAIQDEPQFFGDFYFNLTCTRELPLYSVPGLVDHY